MSKTIIFDRIFVVSGKWSFYGQKCPKQVVKENIIFGILTPSLEAHVDNNVANILQKEIWELKG